MPCLRKSGCSSAEPNRVTSLKLELSSYDAVKVQVNYVQPPFERKEIPGERKGTSGSLTRSADETTKD